MVEIADTDIRSCVRSLLSRHRVDMQFVRLRVASGTVRLGGELLALGGERRALPLGLVGSIEQDILSTRGVRHAFFDLENWRRLSTGEWEPVGPRPNGRRAAERADEHPQPVASTPTPTAEPGTVRGPRPVPLAPRRLAA